MQLNALAETLLGESHRHDCIMLRYITSMKKFSSDRESAYKVLTSANTQQKEKKCCEEDWLKGDREGKQNEGITIKEEEISDLLRCLDAHKSMGLDGLHPRVLKELTDALAKPLSIIYMKSWLTGEVPMDWRVANVTPIYKKGKKEDPGNYRPVSLTSIPGKVMEQVILSAITSHIMGNQGIRPS
ncbi:rna-directed dna polymerase from mobile element jockey-like [Limosa lapponica baueri]|uniref:Rna-directed dna polymerase from mobile element jockey-like n=1 Tax=Limosa lapponica baueri TaxID=1758121 RepID=A0A2I0UJF7_LIMLA|nr:rna-directed dna polymerase from mobile element jockey-like [Limosa lapponica baueri]